MNLNSHQLERLFASTTERFDPTGLEVDLIDGHVDRSSGTVHSLLLDANGEYYVTRRQGGTRENRRPTVKGIVYVAGPMRGYLDANFPAFDTARDLLIAAGYYVFNPADMDRKVGIDGKRELTKLELRKVFRRDMDAVSRCTHVYLLPGWENSAGVRPEGALADVIDLTFLVSHKETGEIMKFNTDVVMATIGTHYVTRFTEMYNVLEEASHSV